MLKSEKIKNKIRNEVYLDENEIIGKLLQESYLSSKQKTSIKRIATHLISECRLEKSKHSMLDAFLMEFGLSNQEGVALMCIAESLLRVPDKLTADRLIAEKIKSGDWLTHLGNSKSIFVNASTWGLMLTGYVVELDDAIQTSTSSWLKRFSSKLGEPIVRKAVSKAMKIMANQYVIGQTIDKALKSKTASDIFSYDMLGEGSRTETDSIRYFNSYKNAIEKIGVTSNQNESVILNDGISVKLSALHNRYEAKQETSIFTKLYPRIKTLCLLAKNYNIGLTIDAEESERLDLAMAIFEKLASERELRNWNGLGFVLQAYLKRAPKVIDWLNALAIETQSYFMVRLVKGAYWDTEIKRAQEKGLKDYPVFTRKENTDICYNHCVYLLSIYQSNLYAQFATHNAYSMALITEIFKEQNFEYQRLHGMGEALHTQMHELKYSKAKTRVYAPVGNHNDLLPYLVRRLLENGANSSFVNRFLDEKEPIHKLTQHPSEKVSKYKSFRNNSIQLPKELFLKSGDGWLNSCGVDSQNSNEIKLIESNYNQMREKQYEAHSLLAGKKICNKSRVQRNPYNSQKIGSWSAATEHDIAKLIKFLNKNKPNQISWPLCERTEALTTLASLIEKNVFELAWLLSIEAGRTIEDAISEIREAADFCRYYAGCATKLVSENQIEETAGGIFLCISPWNFPLAIFVGQVVAALVSGNVVIAKPAEQTPLIAYKAVELFYKSGVPSSVLNLLLADGLTTSKLIESDLQLGGVAFTGSNSTAYKIQTSIANRSDRVSFIAETGGQNCMVVDSSALPEQVVDDVIISAFSSAGQRCSSLRVLFLQEETADNIIEMLTGALESLELGDPTHIKTDIGPLIDTNAIEKVNEHIHRMKKDAKLIAKKDITKSQKSKLTLSPHIFEIKNINQLREEIFGPVLHIIRYKQQEIDSVVNQINSTGYFLTLGVHSRIKAFSDFIFKRTRHGNFYLNRNMIGANVGVNPFGGSMLSGTGPKAGGPNYLFGFSKLQMNQDSKITYEKDTNTNFEKITATTNLVHNEIEILSSFQKWRDYSIDERLNTSLRYKTSCTQIKRIKSLIELPIELSSPTGEANSLSYEPRGIIIFIPSNEMKEKTIIKNISTALICGCAIVLISNKKTFGLCSKIIEDFDLKDRGLQLVSHYDLSQLQFLLKNKYLHNVLIEESHVKLKYIEREFSQRCHGILNIIKPIESLGQINLNWLMGLVIERTKTENLVASGGNTQLFNLN